MKFRYVSRDEIIPWYYGAAWPQDFGLAWVCYPVPFHWLMRWGRELWYAIRGPGYIARVQAAYREGWNDCELVYQRRFDEIEKAELRAMTASEVRLRGLWARLQGR